MRPYSYWPQRLVSVYETCTHNANFALLAFYERGRGRAALSWMTVSRREGDGYGRGRALPQVSQLSSTVVKRVEGGTPADSKHHGFTCKTTFFRSGRCWFRTSDLCRVKANLARSLAFVFIRFRHSQAEYFDKLAVGVRHRSPRLSSNCRQTMACVPHTTLAQVFTRPACDLGLARR
jgi:hypothetical protein